MFKKIIKFIKYHNAFTIGLVLVLVFGGTVLASETVRDNVIGERVVEKQGIDNNALLSANLDNFDFAMQITDVSEDEEKYYIDYVYKTLAVWDGFWQVVDERGSLKIFKQTIRGKDLGLYVQEELSEILDNQLTYLREVQAKGQEQGTTFVQETTRYTALVGLFLDTETRELPGYEPVVKPLEVAVVEFQIEPELKIVQEHSGETQEQSGEQSGEVPGLVGIEMYDEEVEQWYCIKMKSGVMVSKAGKCGVSAVPEPEPTEISPPPNTEILSITSHPEIQTEIVTATFAFESQQENITFQCKIDNQEFAECASPQNYSNLTREQHTFEVRVIDEEGIELQTQTSFTWEIIEPVVEEEIVEPEPEPELSDNNQSSIINEKSATTTESVVDPEPESNIEISESQNIEILTETPESPPEPEPDNDQLLIINNEPEPLE